MDPTADRTRAQNGRLFCNGIALRFGPLLYNIEVWGHGGHLEGLIRCGRLFFKHRTRKSGFAGGVAEGMLLSLCVFEVGIRTGRHCRQIISVDVSRSPLELEVTSWKL